MDLNELKALMAASLLGGSVGTSRQDAATVIGPDKYEIEGAVKIAQKIWDEVLRQEREP